MKSNTFFALTLGLLFSLAAALPVTQGDGNVVEETPIAKTELTTRALKFIEERSTISGVAPCENSSDSKTCSLQSNWNADTKLDTMYLFNNNCDVIGWAYHIDTKATLPYEFTSQLQYVVVVEAWGPTGLPEFKYAGGWYGWTHGLYQRYLLDNSYSYIATFGC